MAAKAVTPQLRIKRVYLPVEADDGMRVLVDRLWPRGLSKHDAQIELWLKQIAPTPVLRKWFGHDPALWDEFRRRYWGELDHNPEAVAQLRELAGKHNVTLVYGAHDEAHNQAVALRDYLHTRTEAGHARSSQ